MSPGDGSYDAIGLMKQLGEQTAGAFADAQKVLGDETPETIMKGKCVIIHDEEKESNQFVVCSSSIILQEFLFSFCYTNSKVATRLLYCQMSSMAGLLMLIL